MNGLAKGLPAADGEGQDALTAKDFGESLVVVEEGALVGSLVGGVQGAVERLVSILKRDMGLSILPNFEGRSGGRWCLWQWSSSLSSSAMMLFLYSSSYSRSVNASFTTAHALQASATVSLATIRFLSMVRKVFRSCKFSFSKFESCRSIAAMRVRDYFFMSALFLFHHHQVG